jgi:dTDP-4-dehydrorhamnose reductase
MAASGLDFWRRQVEMTMEFSGPILVAGKTGQLAQSLIDVGRQRGVSIVAVGRPELDIEDPEAVSRVANTLLPRVIVNAAAYTAVDRAEAEPERAMAVNRDGAAHLAAAAQRLRVPFVHVSSDYVFDGRKPSPYREDDAPLPLGVYGHSKLAGEDAVLNACPSAIVLRTSWVYSPYGTNFVKAMLRLADTRDVVRVVDDQRGAPTAAADLATAIVDLTDSIAESGNDGRGGIYHLTASGDTTWHGLAAEIFAHWRERKRRVPRLDAISTVEYAAPAPRPANSRLDCTKIARTFGIQLPPWHRSLHTCINDLAAAHEELQTC